METGHTFFQVEASTDERLVGRRGTPITVEITTKGYYDYVKEYNPFRIYFSKMYELYEGLPKHLKGRITAGRKIADFMDVSPYCRGAVAVISEKIKNILERLDVSKEEYLLRDIEIKGWDGKFYVLYSPLIPPLTLFLKRLCS